MDKALIVPKNQLTFDEFKDQIDRLGDAETVFDKASDLYDRIIPDLIRILQNFDPTGIAGAIDQFFSDNKAKREQENTLKAIYYLYEAVLVLQEKQVTIETTILEQLPDLTYLYFLKSKEVYDSDKINYYKNIWMNSVIRPEDTLEEKAYVFEVVSSLSMHELSLLAYVERKQGGFAFKDRKPVSVDEIADKLNLSINQTQQMCISLSGKGFLHDYSLSFLDYPGPKNFVMTDYVLLIAKYLEAP